MVFFHEYDLGWDLVSMEWQTVCLNNLSSVKLVATVITGSCHTTRSFYIGGPC